MEDLDRHWTIQKYWSLKRKFKAWLWFKYSVKRLRDDPGYCERQARKTPAWLNHRTGREEFYAD